jgi:hypothetical protein
VSGFRRGGRERLNALVYSVSFSPFQSFCGFFSRRCTVRSNVVLMGRWSESWSRFLSTSLLMTCSINPIVTRQRSIVNCGRPSLYVTVPGGRVLCSAKSPVMSIRSSDSRSVTSLFSPPHKGWCRFKSPSSNCPFVWQCDEPLSALLIVCWVYVDDDEADVSCPLLEAPLCLI